MKAFAETWSIGLESLGHGIRPVDDEWAFGMLCRKFVLFGDARADRFLKSRLEADGATLRKQMESAVRRLLLRASDVFVERHSMAPYYRHVAGATVAATPQDWWVPRAHETGVDDQGKDDHVRRAVRKSALRKVVEPLRDCAVCSAELEKTDGIRTWLRTPNLPGVRACWTHGVRLRQFFELPTLALPPPATASKIVRASRAEIWMARTSRDLLLRKQDPESRRGLGPNTWTKSPGPAAEIATTLADSVFKAYPAEFLERMNLTWEGAKRSFASLVVQARRPVDPRLLILWRHRFDHAIRLECWSDEPTPLIAQDRQDRAIEAVLDICQDPAIGGKFSLACVELCLGDGARFAQSMDGPSRPDIPGARVLAQVLQTFEDLSGSRDPLSDPPRLAQRAEEELLELRARYQRELPDLRARVLDGAALTGEALQLLAGVVTSLSKLPRVHREVSAWRVEAEMRERIEAAVKPSDASPPSRRRLLTV